MSDTASEWLSKMTEEEIIAMLDETEHPPCDEPGDDDDCDDEEDTGDLVPA